MEERKNELRCIWCGGDLEENFSQYEDGSGFYSGYMCTKCHCTTPSFIGPNAGVTQMKARRIASMKAPYINPYEKVLTRVSEYENLCMYEGVRILSKDELREKSLEPVFLDRKYGGRSWEILVWNGDPTKISFKGETDQAPLADYGYKWRVWNGRPSKKLRRLASWDKPYIVFPYTMPKPKNGEYFSITDCWIETKNPHDIFYTKFCINRDGEFMIFLDGFYWWTKDKGWVAGRDYRCWSDKPSEEQMISTAWTWRTEDEQ